MASRLSDATAMTAIKHTSTATNNPVAASPPCAPASPDDRARDDADDHGHRKPNGGLHQDRRRRQAQVARADADRLIHPGHRSDTAPYHTAPTAARAAAAVPARSLKD